MAIETQTFIVDGFTFKLIYHEEFGGDGISINPDNISIKDTKKPGFLKALRFAMKCYPDWKRFQDDLEDHWWIVRNPEHYQKYNKEGIAEAIQILRRWQKSKNPLIHQFDVRTAITRLQEVLLSEPPKPEKPVKDKSGFVYLLQSELGNYKIGRTKSPNDRKKVFGVKLPFEWDFVCTIKTPDMFTLEDELHQRFAGQWINGEWFNLSDQDVEYIKSLAEAQHG